MSFTTSLYNSVFFWAKLRGFWPESLTLFLLVERLRSDTFHFSHEDLVE